MSYYIKDRNHISVEIQTRLSLSSAAYWCLHHTMRKSSTKRKTWTVSLRKSIHRFFHPQYITSAVMLILLATSSPSIPCVKASTTAKNPQIAKPPHVLMIVVDDAGVQDVGYNAR